MSAVHVLPGAAALPDRRASIRELDRAIVNLAGRINAATHDFLVLVRRFDERAGWSGWSFHTCADWLAWRCDLSPNAAREKVRIAHALKTLPAIGRAFAEGRLSYSKVRALTRVAGPANEDELLAFALTTTAARVEERCRELRCGTATSLDEAVRARARRGLSLRRDPQRGVMTLTVELPYETGELVDKALDRALEAEVASAPAADIAEESWTAQRADALVALAKAYLSGDAGHSGGTPDHYQVTVHVDEAALRGGAGRSALPIETVRRLTCDSDVVVITEDAEGNPLNIGRKTRVIPAAIRRAIYARDRHCRYPGCRNTRFLHIHHLRHWKDGGETSVANGMLLCPRHHWLPHEGGFTIEKDWRGRWFFRRPDGRAVPECGYCPEDVLDEGAATAGAYFECGTATNGSQSSAEGPRTSAETCRTSAQAPCASAETCRTSAEVPRHSAETPRHSAETHRTSCVSAEVSHEAVEASSEALRHSAETGASAEANRTSAETCRDSMEVTRLCPQPSDASAETGVAEPSADVLMVKEPSAEAYVAIVPAAGGFVRRAAERCRAGARKSRGCLPSRRSAESRAVQAVPVSFACSASALFPINHSATPASISAPRMAQPTVVPSCPPTSAA